MFFSEKHTPRWLIFAIDTGICLFSIIFAYLLRFNFSIPDEEWDRFRNVIPFVLFVRITSFIIGKTYAGIIRYTGTQDAQRIVLVVSGGSVLFFLNNLITYFFLTNKFFVPHSIIIIDWLLTIFIMTTFRVSVKTLYLEYKNPSKLKRDVLIYGAGELGVITKRTLDRDAGTKYKVNAFVDDDANKTGRIMEGVPIHHLSKLEDLLHENDVAHLIIAIDDIDASKKNKITDICLANNTKVLTLPPVNSWINGELSFKQIKKIRIEDILEREPIQIETDRIRKETSNKRILVTGAAGSIGSELVIQLTQYNPSKLILVDQAETGLYEIENELTDRKLNNNIEVIVGDITNKPRMEYIFKTFRPELVYHAAAYKHVPVMEWNPCEAVQVNVGGSRVIADLSVKYGVQKFVMISTDKAVNPTNVMGASKRIAEMYAQALSRTSNKTKFVTTRFGNVIDSNGSVIPLFRKQIETGGPVTVTHPEITRFFMTISEACQLVLEAGMMGQGGEVFAFDMGKAIKIFDLARKMVKLSGLTLGKDIQVVFTGLRPGEKLYEEVLASKENTLATHHPKILIAQSRECDYDFISREVDNLLALVPSQENKVVVKKMKDIVPEFLSQNSPFEKLDEKFEGVPFDSGSSERSRTAQGTDFRSLSDGW